ncbi:major facilitator superfamily transporter [Tritrichomonas foetus]|uniref:Major facilitator superfamily transporter n=1 Tax=Tritrichomonas foetus TaxID=1144522 RepID=A0A1J4JP33_9EUKA|nr:major facilitator superfamily transporter [Tritrichomonas foetus]|eukprot:OHS99028.1 major facilitator superfamily transporter [Tritrichomonas foetus]
MYLANKKFTKNKSIKMATKLNFTFIQTLVLILGCCAYMLIFFYRYTPTVLTKQLSEALNVPEDKISIFGSMYFWTYAVMQPIGGVLGDVISPGKMIALFTIISGIGSITMGQSSNFILSCAARCLVGIGCGPIFVPVTRILANWYSPRGYALANGILLAMGSVGGCLAQGPLSSLCEIIDWRWAFRLSTIVGVIVAVLCFFLLKTKPADFGFDEYENLDNKPINAHNFSSVDASEGAYGGKVSVFGQLIKNLGIVLRTPQFYVFVVWDLFSPPTFYNLTALWASRYLQDVMMIEKKSADYMILILSLAMIIGSPLWPFLSNIFHSRRWVLFASTLIGFLCSLAFVFIRKNIGTVLVLILLFLFAAGSNANITIVNALVKETNHATAATMLGCANFFPFFATGLLQIASPELIHLADGDWSKPGHSPRAYALGLWLPNAIFTGIAVVASIFIKETYGKKPEVTTYN